MKRTVTILVFLLVLAAARGRTTVVVSRAATSAPVLYGEWNPNWQTASGGVNNQVITSRETAMAHQLNLIHWYASGAVSNGQYVGEGYTTYDHIMVDNALSLGRTPLVSWGLPVGFENIAGNTTVLDDWVNGMKATGKTIIVRLFWEFNDPGTGNGDFHVCGAGSHTPASLITTWKYIVNRFRADGATNVKWMWNPDGTMGTQMYGDTCGSLATAYPGDSYVDYRGFDTYDYNNQTEYNAENTQTGSAVPMILGEVGTTDATGAASWVNDLSTRINNGSMGQVAGVVWFNDQSWVVTPPSNPNTNTAVKAMLQTAKFQASTALTIYDDRLEAGWTDISWDATVNYANSTPVYQGSASIALTITAPYGGLGLKAPAPMLLTGYAHLTFAMQASTSGQAYEVWCMDGNENLIGNVLPLYLYGGQPIAGQWTLYSIPVADFGLDSHQIQYLVIQDFNGTTQPPVYIDQIVLQPAS